MGETSNEELLNEIERLKKENNSLKRRNKKLAAREEVIEDNKKLLDLFFNQAFDGFFIMTIDEPAEWNDDTNKEEALEKILSDLKVTKANKALCAMYGEKHEEFLGTSALEMFQFDPDEAKAAFTKLFDAGTVNLETYEKKYDGTMMWTEGDMIALYTDDQKLRGCFGIRREITERKKTEETIIESRENLSVTLDSIADGVIVTDSGGNITRMNPVAEKLTGWRAKDAVGNSFDEVIKLIDVPTGEPVKDPMMRSLLEQKITDFTNNTELIDKEERCFRITSSAAAIRKSDGEIIGMIFVFRDMTQLVRKEMALEASEKRLNRAQAVAKVGSWELDILSGELWISEEAFSIYGIEKFSFDMTPEEMQELNRKLNSLVHPDDRGGVEQALYELINRGKPYEQEFRLRPENSDEEKVIHSRAEIIKSENDKALKISGTIQDITERKRMEQEIKEAKERAEESSRIKSSILENMSHELRTPMNGILGISEIILEELDNSDMKSMVSQIIKSGRRLMRTLNSVLDLSLLEAEEFPLNIETEDLGRTTSEAALEYRDYALEKNLELILNAQEGTYAEIDKTLYKQALANIIDNAIKYTDKGQINIETSLNRKSNEIAVRVSDTGIGIPDEYKEMIFDAFRQVSEGLSRSFEGTGLGLTITRKLVEKMNGRIEIESTPGEGSIFTLYIPAGDKKAKTVPDAEPAEVKELFRDKVPEVLLVEDNSINVEVVEKYLAGCCNVDSTGRGETAVEMAARKKYDLILMDINLGSRMNGIEAAKKIREIEGYEDIPIAAVTGYALPGDRKKFRIEGCTHYLPKPFRRDELMEVVNEALSEKADK